MQGLEGDGNWATVVACTPSTPAPRTKTLVFFFENRDLGKEIGKGLESLTATTLLNKSGLSDQAQEHEAEASEASKSGCVPRELRPRTR